MVVSGIMIGNWTRYIGFSKETEDHLDHFWELVDEFFKWRTVLTYWYVDAAVPIPSRRLDFDGLLYSSGSWCTLFKCRTGLCRL